MSKKVNKISKSTKAENDFHFIVIISVFATLTIFAANYMAQTRRVSFQNKQQALPVTQLNLVTTYPSIKPALKPTLKPTPRLNTKTLPIQTVPPTMIPWHK